MTICANIGTATVYQAEMTAITETIKFLNSQATPEETKLILVDSQAALLTIKNKDITSISHDSLMAILKLTQNIKFRWIQAHTGHVSNELADRAAKQATRRPQLIHIPLAVSIVKGEVMAHLKNVWDTEWMNLPGHRQSKIFCKGPKDSRIPDLRRLGRFRTGTLIHFITGHAFTKRHNFIMGLRDDKSCSLCQGTDEEMPEHIILNCPALSNWRFCIFGGFQLMNANTINYDQLSDFLADPRIRSLEYDQGTTLRDEEQETAETEGTEEPEDPGPYNQQLTNRTRTIT